MKSTLTAESSSTKSWPVFLGPLLMILALALPASASLGGVLDSVHEDAVRVKGSVRVTTSERYAIYEITTSTGTIIREFVAPSGTVFGVAWEGPFVPEMRRVLGAYFQQYSAALHAAVPKHLSRSPISIQQPGLVFEIGGHVGWYYGRAYVPSSVPKDAPVKDIH
jgi:hypothetical protein